MNNRIPWHHNTMYLQGLEEFFKMRNLLADYVRAVGVLRVLSEVIIMIVLGGIELFKLFDFSDDLSIVDPLVM